MKPTSKKPAKNKRAPPARKPAAAPRAVAARRSDYGAPVDGFFAKQSPPLRAIVEELRGLVQEAAPDATAALKWGMPFFTRGGEMMCALSAFKSHVNLILPGLPGTYPHPDQRLEGDGKTGKHLKLRSVDALPRPTVRGWLKTAAARAKSGAKRGEKS